MPSSHLHEPVLAWYADNARQLPWRNDATSPWGVLVSEVMLQQTPVARVLPVYVEWLRRWPEPVDLAASPPGEAVRAWGRLGYPRRALRLHSAAARIVDRHDGQVPSSYDELLGLPGLGTYTAAAVATFTFGERHAVLDTNVRRVLARALGGREQPQPRVTRAETELAATVVPDVAPVAAEWAVAVMELGALVCTARAPRCGTCPVATACAWHRAGKPAYDGTRRPAQTYTGTDRQARGRVLELLRSASGPVTDAQLAAVWPDAEQLDRAVKGLLADGLLQRSTSTYALPGTG